MDYSNSLIEIKRDKEAKALLRKMIPVARRVLGESRTLTLVMRWHYAMVLYEDPAATLEDLREAVTTLEDDERIARRVFGGAHPVGVAIEHGLENARAALRAREPPPPLPRTIDAALSYLEEASPEALATHRVRLVALADRATAAPHPSPVASRDDEDALDEDFYFSHKIYSDAK